MLTDTLSTNPHKAVWCAELLMCFDLPDPPTTMRIRFADEAGPPQATFYAPGNHDDPGIFIAYTADVLVVAIQGSHSVELGRKLWDGYLGGSFAERNTPVNAYLELLFGWAYNMMLIHCPGLRPNVLLTGHSLGGAIVAGMMPRTLGSRTTRNIQGITFGAPKPGNVDLARALEPHNLTRWMNTDDWVPLIPPRLTYASAGGIYLGRRTLQRFGNFVQPGHGVIIDAAGSIASNPVPGTAVLPELTVSQVLFPSYQHAFWRNHHLHVYRERLNRYIARFSLNDWNDVHGSDAEQGDRVSAAEIRREEIAATSAIFHTGAVQNANPVYIPIPNLFRARKVNRVWYVYFGDRQICAAPNRSRAQGLAAAGNNFLRRLQRQAVVHPEVLAAQFTEYTELASNPESGFVPTLNTIYPPS